MPTPFASAAAVSCTSQANWHACLALSLASQTDSRPCRDDLCTSPVDSRAYAVDSRAYAVESCARKQWTRARMQWTRTRKQWTRTRKQWTRTRKQWTRTRKQWTRTRKQWTRVRISLIRLRIPLARTQAPGSRARIPWREAPVARTRECLRRRRAQQRMIRSRLDETRMPTPATGWRMSSIYVHLPETRPHALRTRAPQTRHGVRLSGFPGLL
jgi:hypothetical protein